MARVKNYINNKDLYDAMVAYKEKLMQSSGSKKPQVSNYIGESIVLICNNLIKKPCFSGYTIQWKQEMISDGIVDCFAAIDNFDCDKYNNPFAFFTMIAFNAFIRRIQKEKRQTYIKHKNFENTFLMDGLWENSENIHLKANEYSNDIVKMYEDKLTSTKKKGKVSKNKKIQEIDDEELAFNTN